MKKGMILGVVVGIALMAALFAIPVLAQNPSDNSGDENVPPIDQGTSGSWQAMWNACQSGDWNAMADAAIQFHGDDFSDMPCYGWDGNGGADTQNQDSSSWWQGMGTMMDDWGNMMGSGNSGSWSGMGGMMGW